MGLTESLWLIFSFEVKIPHQTIKLHEALDSGPNTTETRLDKCSHSSLCSSSWPRTPYTDQSGLELAQICLPLLPEFRK